LVICRDHPDRYVVIFPFTFPKPTVFHGVLLREIVAAVIKGYAEGTLENTQRLHPKQFREIPLKLDMRRLTDAIRLSPTCFTLTLL